MKFAILLFFSVIFSFGVCFASQYAVAGKYSEKKIKYLLPQGKKQLVAMIIATVMMFFFSIFMNIVYQNSIIENIKLLTLLAVLFSAAYTDWKKHIISNKLVIAAILCRVAIFLAEMLLSMENALSEIYSALITAGIIFVLGFLISFFSKGAVGMGDIKLLTVMALYQGASGILCSFVVSLIAAFFYCVFALITKRVKRKDIIPFAPFLLGGTYLSMLLFGL